LCFFGPSHGWGGIGVVFLGLCLEFILSDPFGLGDLCIEDYKKNKE